MGAQWKQKGREASALKRGQVFGKLAKEIVVAAKAGGADPDLNARLYVAIEAAKNFRAQRHHRARGKKRRGTHRRSDQLRNRHLRRFRPAQSPRHCRMSYRQSQPHRSRDSRALQGRPTRRLGSVALMFNHLGIVEAHHPQTRKTWKLSPLKPVRRMSNPKHTTFREGHIGARFFLDRTDLDVVGKFLSKAGWIVTASEMSYVAKNTVEVPEAQRPEVVAFLTAIDEHDDVIASTPR